MTQPMRRGTKQVLDHLLAGGLNREEAVAGVAEAAGVVEWPGVGEGLVEDAATAVLVGAPGGGLLTRKRVARVAQLPEPVLERQTRLRLRETEVKKPLGISRLAVLVCPKPSRTRVARVAMGKEPSALKKRPSQATRTRLC
jgi:hypothetical protein